MIQDLDSPFISQYLPPLRMFGAARRSVHLLSTSFRAGKSSSSVPTITNGNFVIWHSVANTKRIMSTVFDPAANLPPRRESDSMGSLPIAEGTLWGCQTERSLGNFKIGGVESKSKSSSKSSSSFADDKIYHNLTTLPRSLFLFVLNFIQSATPNNLCHGYYQEMLRLVQ